MEENVGKYLCNLFFNYISIKLKLKQKQTKKRNLRPKLDGLFAGMAKFN